MRLIRRYSTIDTLSHGLKEWHLFKSRSESLTLYGRQAVELVLANGSPVRIGSQQPEVLVRAILLAQSEVQACDEGAAPAEATT